MNERVKALLSYTGILSFLFLKNESEFVRFHAKQGATLTITSLIALLIPIIGWVIILPFIFISAFTAALRAWDGKKWKIPLIKKFIKYEEKGVIKWLK